MPRKTIKTQDFIIENLYEEVRRLKQTIEEYRVVTKGLRDDIFTNDSDSARQQGKVDNLLDIVRQLSRLVS